MNEEDKESLEEDLGEVLTDSEADEIGGEV
jgi:hypothetical protein